MARGQQDKAIRAALSGRNTGRAPLVVPEATATARMNVRTAAIEFIGDHHAVATARLRRQLHEAEAQGTVHELLCDLAENVSDMLGYPYRSGRVSVQTRCRAECADTFIAPAGVCVRGPGTAVEAEAWHPECVPAHCDMGFNRHAPDADPEVWLLRALAEFEAGIVRPDANYEVKRAQGLNHHAAI